MGNSYSEESDYSNEGSASLLSEWTNTPPIGPSDSGYAYSRFDWEKERERSGSESASIAGHTSGGTFQYTTYSNGSSRDDTGHFEGELYYEGSGMMGVSWSRQTLVFDETMNYDYTADAANYTVSIEYEAPWTLSQSSNLFGLWTTTDTVIRENTETGEDVEKLPPAPVEVMGSLGEAKEPEYYGLAAGVLPSRVPGAPDGGGGNPHGLRADAGVAGGNQFGNDNPHGLRAEAITPGNEPKLPPAIPRTKSDDPRWFPGYERGGDAFLEWMITWWPKSFGGPAGHAQRMGQLAATGSWIAETFLGAMKWTYRAYRNLTGAAKSSNDLDDIAERLQANIRKSAGTPPSDYSPLEKAEFSAGFGRTDPALNWASSVIPVLTGLIRAILSKIPPGLAKGVFAQGTFREEFSKQGKLFFKNTFGLDINSIDDLARALRRGIIKPSDLPVHYIMKDGKLIILNTRTSEALKRAGISPSSWKGVNKTGDPEFEKMLRLQLDRNLLDYDGFPYPPISEGK